MCEKEYYLLKQKDCENEKIIDISDDSFKIFDAIFEKIKQKDLPDGSLTMSCFYKDREGKPEFSTILELIWFKNYGDEGYKSYCYPYNRNPITKPDDLDLYEFLEYCTAGVHNDWIDDFA